MKKLSIVFNPKFQASGFVVEGVNLSAVNKIPLQFQTKQIYYMLYGITLALHVYHLAFFFRYTKATRLSLKSIQGAVLFWDCCYFEEYQMLNAVLNNVAEKNAFLWNPLARWSTNVSYTKKKLSQLQSRNFRFLTFDPRDSNAFGIPLVHNVHRKISLDPPVHSPFDFYFVGYAKGRKDTLLNLENQLQTLGFHTRFLLIENKADQISQLDNIRNSSECACIVDIVSKNQSGLTLRPFDALFLRKKLITNNPIIRDQDFYHPSNIFIIHDLKLDGLDEFMKTPYHEIDSEIVNKYEVNQWLQHNFALSAE